MKYFLIKFAHKLFIPVVFFSSISLIFENELAKFPFIKLLRACLLIIIILVVAGGLLDLLDNNKEK